MVGYGKRFRLALLLLGLSALPAYPSDRTHGGHKRVGPPPAPTPVPEPRGGDDDFDWREGRRNDDPGNGFDTRARAVGWIRTSNLYSNQDRRSLTINSIDRIDILPLHVERYEPYLHADVDVETETDLGEDTLLDAHLHSNTWLHAFEDPQGGRYRQVDLLFDMTFAHELDRDLITRLDVSGRIYEDRLFPELDVSVGAVKGGFEQELSPHSHLGFTFGLEGARVDAPSGENYIESSAQMLWTHFSPNALFFQPLPVHHDEPERDPEAFEYSGELELEASKKLFPLGRYSTIAPFVDSVEPIREPEDRLFKEIEVDQESLTLFKAKYAYRDHTDDSFLGDNQRFEGEIRHKFKLHTHLDLTLSDQFTFRDYLQERPAFFVNSLADNRFRVGLENARPGRYLAFLGGWQALRFTDTDDFDANIFEGRSLWNECFRQRYWLMTDIALYYHQPSQIRTLEPQRRSVVGRLRALAELDDGDHFSFGFEETQTDVQRFETFFDADYREDRFDVRYHHVFSPRWRMEAGLYELKRVFPRAPVNDREEYGIFIDTLIRL